MISNSTNINTNNLIYKKSTEKITNTASISIDDQLKAMFPDVKLNYKSIPSSINEDSIRRSGFGFGAEYGSIHNVAIDPKVAQRMEQDPKYRQEILNKVIKDLSSPIPQIPGVKVASAGTIVHSDGSITGYIVGEPTEEAKNEEAKAYVSLRKKRQKDAQERKAESEESQRLLDARAQLTKLGMNVNAIGTETTNKTIF